MQKDQGKRVVDKELAGREMGSVLSLGHYREMEFEFWEIVDFKLYKSQILVVEQVIETAALMLGTDKSRKYCLEMNCADLLAGANLDNGNPDILPNPVVWFLRFLPSQYKRALLHHRGEKAAS